jgi:F0F1-type ATP synthase assembly protein I
VKTVNLKEMMKDSAPKATPKPAEGEVSERKKSDQSVFIAAVLDMSWQLAIVFLVPTIGGHELDVHLKTSPLWFIIGCILALVGCFVVLRRILGQLNQSFIHPGSKK